MSQTNKPDAVRPAAPMSQLELETKIDAITCEGCGRDGILLSLTYYGKRHVQHPDDDPEDEDISFPCTAKGTEVIALLAASESLLKATPPEAERAAPPSESERNNIFTALAVWLENESVERMKEAMGRRDYAESMRSSTKEDLKSAMKIAEQMAGRKLPGGIRTVEGARKSAQIDESIAGKLEIKSRMIGVWAETIRAELAAAPAAQAESSPLEKRLRELSAKWRKHAYLIDDNTGLSECSRTASCIRQRAEELDAALSEKGKL